jgi:hypothetical protein
MVQKTSIIHLSPKTPPKARRYHLSHSSIASVANSPLTSIQVDYSSKHIPRQPKPTKENIPQRTSNLRIKKKMIHRLPFILHIQHLSNTMTHRCQRLSMVRIFPKTADQAKKATLNGAFVCQPLFQGKWKLSLQIMTL